MKKRTLRIGCALLLHPLWAHGQPGTVLWEAQLGDLIATSPAITSDGAILVGAMDGKLHAVSKTGEQRWAFETLQSYSIAVSVGTSGLIYVGSDKLYVLDASGTKRWDFDPDVHWFGMPVEGADGTIYVTGADTKLYALSPEGQLRWAATYPSGLGGDPVLGADGTLYLGLGHGGFGAVNTDGVVRWGQGFGATVHSSAALADDGTIYLGVSGGTIAEGWLVALGPDGTERWRYAGEAQAIGAPAIGPDGTVYYTFDSGRVVAVNPDGQRCWEYELGHGPSGYLNPTPVVGASRSVYVAAVDGSLRALDANGQVQWQYAAGSRITVSPALAPEGVLYVGTHSGKLIALRVEDSLPATGQWAMNRRDPRHSASRAQAPAAPPPAPTGLAASQSAFTHQVVVTWDSVGGATDYEVWRAPVPNPEAAIRLGRNLPATARFEDATATPGEDFFYFVRASNAAGASPLAGAVQGRRRVAQPGELVWKFTTHRSMGTPALGSDGVVYVGAGDGRFYALLPNGAVKWVFPYGGNSVGTPCVAPDGTVYFTATTGRSDPAASGPAWSLLALTTEGTKKWQFDSAGTTATDVALAEDGTVYVGFSNASSGDPATPMLVALTPAGATQWKLATGEWFWGSPVLGADGAIYVGTRDGFVFSVSPQGRVRWRLQTGGSFLGAIALDASGVLYVSGPDLLAINPDGVVRWKYPALDAGASPTCIGDDGTIYTGTSDGKVHALRPNRTQKWEFQAPTMPGAMAWGADGTLFFGATSNLFAPIMTLYALDRTGQLRWGFPTTGAIGPPVLGPDNLAYFGCADGSLYAVRTAGPLGTTPWPIYQHDPQHTARAVAPPPPPAAPTVLTASDRTFPAYVRLEWTSVAGATGYDLYRSTGADPTGAEPIAADITGQWYYHDSSAQAEVAYTYWLKARNPGGASDLSLPATGVRRQPVPGDLLFEWQLDGMVNSSPALGPDGTIYVGVHTGTQSLMPSKLYALNADGTIKWSFEGSSWIEGAPAIGPDGTVYYGAYHRNIIALNPDGTKKWEYVPAGPVVAGPAVGADGAIYIGAQDGKLYALNPDGTLRWSYSAVGQINASTAVDADGAVYFVGGDGLYALNANGSLRWRVVLGGGFVVSPIYSSPVLGADHTVYAGSELAGIVAFNLDGTRRWTYTGGGGVLASPVIDTRGNILMGSASFFSLKPDGSLNWSFDTGSVWATAAVAADGLIYVATRGGSLLSLQPDGAKAWEAAVGAPMASSPVIAPDGTIYVGADDGKVRAFYGTAPLANTPWPMYQREPRHTGRGDTPPAPVGKPGGLTATDAEFNNQVRLSWQSVREAFYYEVWRGVTPEVNAAVRIAYYVAGATNYTDSAVEAERTYYYWVRAGNTLGLGDFSAPEAGSRRAPLPGEKVGEVAVNFSTASAPALGPDGAICFGGRDRRLHALNSDLTPRWDFPASGQLGGFTSTTLSEPVVGDDGAIYFGAPDGRLYALNSDGTKRWDFRVNDTLEAGPALGPDGTIYLGAPVARKLYALAPAGDKRWEYQAGGLILHSPAVGADGTVYFGAEDRVLYALNPEGSLKWKYPGPGAVRSTPAIGPDGALYFSTLGRRVLAVNADGSLRWSFTAGGEVNAPVVIGPDCTVYVGCADRRLYAVGSDGKKKWDFLTGSEILGAALLGADGTIFFGSQDRKFYALKPDGLKLWELVPRGTVSGRPITTSPTITADGRVLVGTDDGYFFAIHSGTSLAEAPWPAFRRDPRHTGRVSSPLGLAGGRRSVRAMTGAELRLDTALSLAGRQLVRLELHLGTSLVAAAASAPWQLVWSSVPAGTNVVTLRGTDDLGCTYLSHPIQIVATDQSTLRIWLNPAGQPVLTFATVGGRRYVIEHTTNLRTWTAASPPFSATGPETTWPDATAGAVSIRFYRVQTAP